MFDIIIIGAGPSGATLSRLLNSKFKILVLDQRRLDLESGNGFEKSCGGLLAPDAQEILAILGLGVPKEILVGPQIFTVRTIDLKNSIERFYQRHYINFNRERFDRWLVSLIPETVTLKFGAALKSIKIADDSIEIKYLLGKEEFHETTRVLIGADGANSLVRKLYFSKFKSPKKYISIQEWYKVKKAHPYFSAIFDPEVTDFYSWTIPKDDTLLIGTAIPIQDNAIDKFKLLKYKLKDYGFKFKKPVKRNGAFILRPKRINQICLGNKRIALIGEAAGWISPSSAEGLSYAFRSALNIANAINNNFENFYKYYVKYSRKLKLNILLKNLKSPAMYNSFLRKIILKSGFNSITPINTGNKNGFSK
ncbi:FAD-binding protein [Candidatus Dependentiae bacterium]|nr:FAD-binding protein [Candidatus Dependentiae bacterium]